MSNDYPMSDGEKMVWAAVFAQCYHQEVVRYSRWSDEDEGMPSIVTAVENAWGAVHALRGCGQAVLDGFGDGGIYDFLQQMRMDDE